MSLLTDVTVLGCPNCGETLYTSFIKFESDGHDFGLFTGFECKKGHQYLDGASRDAIRVEAKELGMWKEK